MKVIIGTSIVPTTTLIIYLFVELGILLTSFPQFVYAQTVKNEIIENTLERVKEATQGTKEVLEQANKADQTGVVNETSRSKVQENEEMKSSWKNYTDEYDGFTIEYPSSWIANNYSRIENSYQNASFEYRAHSASHDTYKVLTRISAIDTVVNYDSNYDDRVLLEKPNMTKYIIDGEKAGSYSYLQKDKESFLQGNEVEEVITIHNGKEYHFTFEEKDIKFLFTDFPKIKKHMLNSIRWLK
jgi:hypothetical protein